MKPALLGFAVGVLLVVSAGCRDAAANNDLVVLNTQTLDAPTTIAPGATLTLGLNVEVGGCFTFDHIESSRTASAVTLTAWGRDIRAGITDRAIMCPTLFLESHEYQLDPPFENPFTVQVDRGRLPPLTATVHVQ
jgi:hypothetical protein